MQVSFLAVDHLFPDWKIWTQFIDQTVSAFKLDGLVESHPIEVCFHSTFVLISHKEIYNDVRSIFLKAS